MSGDRGSRLLTSWRNLQNVKATSILCIISTDRLTISFFSIRKTGRDSRRLKKKGSSKLISKRQREFILKMPNNFEVSSLANPPFRESTI